ncbi:MAG TPA: CcdB family protein [Microvirga sp.]|jgi:toxin CcdB|nr:CcdB family protein [Microvirga sp.]
MRQFDVFAHPDEETADAYPYLMVLQSDFIAQTASVIAAPLIEAAQRDTRLYPAFRIKGERYTLMISDLAAVPRTMLRTPVDNLAPERSRIIAALDLLFTGI